MNLKQNFVTIVDTKAELICYLKSIYDETCGVIEGARAIVAIKNRLGLYNDVDFNIFESVDSETDHFPVGELRNNWDPIALEKIDAEIKSYENDLKDEVKETCLVLIEKYSKHDK